MERVERELKILTVADTAGLPLDSLDFAVGALHRPG